jgi:elongation factor 3
MTGPALAVMIPLLVRALNERTTAILRPTTIIIDNLCKLVKDPAEAGQFLPQLLPGLDKIIETAAIPEVRELAQNAKTTLQRVGGTELSHHHEDQEIKILQTEQDILTKSTTAMSKEIFVDSFAQVSLEYLSKVLAELIFQDSFKETEWKEFALGYLSSFLLPNQPVTHFYKDSFDFYLQEYKVFSFLYLLHSNKTKITPEKYWIETRSGRK